MTNDSDRIVPVPLIASFYTGISIDFQLPSGFRISRLKLKRPGRTSGENDTLMDDDFAKIRAQSIEGDLAGTGMSGRIVYLSRVNEV